jgi:hypothetical protein
MLEVNERTTEKMQRAVTSFLRAVTGYRYQYNNKKAPKEMSRTVVKNAC